eukprot:CAMPEP_0171215532 /NCGR_PEP_ID=MMETSP0790-20130122/31715_1 /TAXON_ID=2925 /ORGANISM="Alexandrium catenella, Strain OF101" /LENGTH=464 /DNA_ID=CAMNT_0011681287 /DNA_START=75 /DNA_END=1469 /DNA_ORIENTATION=-
MADGTDERSLKDGEALATSTGSPGNVYLLSYGFNQNYSCFVCGTTAGFRVYTVSPVCEVHRREHSTAFQHSSVVLVAMLFKTNIFAMVTMSDDDPTKGGLNKVQIWDDLKGKFVGELRSRNEVKGVALRRDIIAMVCEYAIYVYTFDKLRVILHLTTNANSKGLCVLAAASDPWILCCPGQSTGAVRVQVGQDDRATHVFTAHQTALAALALNESGSLIATASEKGTVVKVFQRSDGQLLYRLRRSARPAVISCLTFRSDDRFLAVASSSSTVHIFKLDPATALEAGKEAASPGLGPAEDPPLPAEAVDPRVNPTLEQMIHKAVTKVASRAAAETVSDVVKGVMPKYFNDLRSFAHFRLPDIDLSGQATVDARSKQARILGPQLAFHKEDPKLFVLHYSGMIYECKFKPDHDPSLGTQDCGFMCATTFFAVRPDFKVQGPSTQVATVAGGAQEDDEEAEEWQLL